MSTTRGRLNRLEKQGSNGDVLIFKTMVCDREDNCEFLGGLMLAPDFQINLLRGDSEDMADFERRILVSIDEQNSAHCETAKQEFQKAIRV